MDFRTPNRPVRRVAAVSLIAFAAVVAGVYAWGRAARGATSVAAPPSVPVRLAEVQQRDVPVLLRSVGTVRSLRSVEIRTQIDGRLVEMPAREGQPVRRGELLARIDDRAIAAALAQARAQRSMAQAQLDIAQRDLQRYRELREDDAIAAQTLDQQSAQVAQLQATVRSHEAAIAAQEVQLSYTRILSPIDGRVGIRNVDEGNFVRANDTQSLFSVVQLDPVSVEIALPQARLPQLQALLSNPSAQSVPVRAYSGDGVPLLAEGRLALIDNRVSAAAGTVRARAEFANSHGRLWPDQSVVVDMRLRTIERALIVPSGAVQRGADNNFVWRVRDGRAEQSPVQVVHTDEEVAVITGIQVGDSVVVDGASRLRAGAAVRDLDAAAPVIQKAT